MKKKKPNYWLLKERKKKKAAIFYDYHNKYGCPNCFSLDVIRLRYDFYECRKCGSYIISDDLIKIPKKNSEE